MQDNIEVGERIRELRNSFNMSREKFSEMIDISDVFLGQIERGERSLSIKTLKKIVKFTGCSTDYILFGNDKNNSTTTKIKKILNNCSDETLEYIYEMIYHSYSFLKKIDKKFHSFLASLKGTHRYESLEFEAFLLYN